MDYGQLVSPPDSPEMPEAARRFPAWPPWFAIAGFFGSLIGTLLIVGVLSAAFGIDADDAPPWFVIAGTVIQSFIFLGTAIVLARTVARPRAWHFGLRRVPFGQAVGWAAVGVVTFYIVAGVYGALVNTDAKQETVQSLGGDSGTLGLIVAGLMVMTVAPVAEEIFFRGFFYRSLRTGLPIWAAVAIDGLIFGIIHIQDFTVDDLLLIVPLGILGAIFCLVYEKTGSLFTVIAMHAFNNAIAFGAQAGGDAWIVSLVIGPLALLACALAPRLLPRIPRPEPA